MCKKFHNFLMKNEGEINLWKMDKHWGENMNKSKTNGQHKGQPWHCGNICLHLTKRHRFRGAQEMSWLARPNETVNKASNNQWALIFLGLACNIRVLTMARQHAILTAIVHHHSSWQNGIKHNDATQMAMQSKCSCNKQQQQLIVFNTPVQP